VRRSVLPHVLAWWARRGSIRAAVRMGGRSFRDLRLYHCDQMRLNVSLGWWFSVSWPTGGNGRNGTRAGASSCHGRVWELGSAAGRADTKCLFHGIHLEGAAGCSGEGIRFSVA
jgi:hypothetical protein